MVASISCRCTNTETYAQRIGFYKFFMIKKKIRKIQFMFPAWRHFLNLEVKLCNRDNFFSLPSQTWLSALIRFNNI